MYTKIRYNPRRRVFTIASKLQRYLGVTLTCILASNTYAAINLTSSGYVDVTDYGATPNANGNDDRPAIQAAIDYAIENRKAVYFPPGVYQINDTLVLERDYSHGWGDDRMSHVLIGSETRPTIKLKNNASGFSGSSGSRKPIIYCRQTGSKPGTSSGPKQADNFNNAIRNLIIDTGSGNAGAVAIDFIGAEGSAITDVKIYSSSGQTYFAGLENLVGSGGSVTNLEVIGGHYGVYCPDWDTAQPGPVLTACRFTDQETLAIYYSAWTPLTMVGIEIEKDAGPVIQLVKSTHEGSGALNLIDATVDLTSPGWGGDERTLIKHNRANYHLRNVYVNNVGKVADDTTTTDTGDDYYAGGSSEWRYITAVADGPDYAVSHGGVTYKGRLINGTLQDGRYQIATTAASPTVDCLAKHGWSQGFAAPDRSDVISAATYGATGNDSSDDSTAIQNAINAASAANGGDGVPLILPAGTYKITTPLQLKWNTEFFGVGRNLTILDASGMTSNSGANVAVALSNNGTGSSCAIADMKIFYPPSGEHVGGLYWQAGHKSIIRSVWVMPAVGANDDEAVTRLHINGNGGGRIYNWQCNVNRDSDHPDMRNVKITNTSQDLAFYMFHNQHISPEASMKVEVDNSSNISFYGVKQEINAKLDPAPLQSTLPLSMYFQDCSNIQIATQTGIGPTRANQGMITFVDCDDVSVSNVGSWGFAEIDTDNDGEPDTPDAFYYLRDWETIGGNLTSIAKEIADTGLMLNFMIKGTPDFDTGD